MAKQTPKTVVPTSETTDADDPNLVDIRDEDKHLLFKYNALTDEIEIKVRGKLYRVNIPELRFMVKRNVLSSDPLKAVDVIPQATSQDELGQAESSQPTPTPTTSLEQADNQNGSDSALDNPETRV